MAFTSLREFVETLERDGNLVRVTKPVSTELEMTEIQTRLLSEQGPAVIFENPIRSDGEKSEIPVLLNLFGTISRVAEGMGFLPKVVSIASLAARYAFESVGVTTGSPP